MNCRGLWANRFYSTALDEAHLWTAIRYVELNPVRAGLVRRARLVKLQERLIWLAVQVHFFKETMVNLMNMNQYEDKLLNTLQKSVANETSAARIADIYAIIGNIYYGKFENQVILFNDYSAFQYLEEAKWAYLKVLSLFSNFFPIRNRMAVTLLVMNEGKDKVLEYLTECEKPILNCSSEISEDTMPLATTQKAKEVMNSPSIHSYIKAYGQAVSSIDFYEMERLAIIGIIFFITDAPEKADLYFKRAFQDKKYSDLKKFLYAPLRMAKLISPLEPLKQQQLDRMIRKYQGEINNLAK